MHSISYFWHLSRLIYGPRNFQENKRAVVFFCSCRVQPGLI